MIGDLFDSPWKILIVALVIIVLFGSKKLPSAARSLGQSMRILKKEVQGLHEDEPESSPPGGPEGVPIYRRGGQRRVIGRCLLSPTSGPKSWIRCADAAAAVVSCARMLLGRLTGDTTTFGKTPPSIGTVLR